MTRYIVKQVWVGVPVPKLIGWHVFDTERWSYPVLVRGREFSTHADQAGAQADADILNREFGDNDGDPPQPTGQAQEAEDR